MLMYTVIKMPNHDSTEERPAKRQRLDMVETFIVVADQEEQEQEFIVHKNIAIRASKFFKAALNGEWKEGQERRVPLPEVKSDIFEGYLQWLYTGNVTFETRDSAAQVRSFVLGDFLGDPKFSNAVIDNMVASYLESDLFPNARAVEIAWQETPAKSPLRAVILEIWSTIDLRLAASLFENNQRFPKDFVVGYLLLVSRFHLAKDCRFAKGNLKKACSQHKHIIPGEKRK